MTTNRNTRRLTLWSGAGILFAALFTPPGAAANVKTVKKSSQNVHNSAAREVTVRNLKLGMDEELRTFQTARPIRYAVKSTAATEPAVIFLASVAKTYGMDPTLSDLVQTDIRTTPAGTHTCYEQVAGGIPVYQSNICVTVNNRNIVSFLTNSYRPEVLDAPPEPPLLSEADAIEKANAHLGTVEKGSSPSSCRLMYLVTADDGVKLAYRVFAFTAAPFGAWEIFVDANLGDILQAESRAFGVTGKGRIFDPDPLTTSKAAYGQAGRFVDNNDADAPELTAALETVDLPDVTRDVNGNYLLEGPYCKVTDIDGSGDVFPISPDGNFFYTRSAPEFEAVMAYYFIDHMNRYIESLGYHASGLDAFKIDPHGEGDSRTAHFIPPPTNAVTVGDGMIDGAEDGGLLIHEFSHAVAWHLTPGGFIYHQDDISQSVIEGTADYWAASYATEISDFGWDMVEKWWYGPEGGSRTVDTDMIYPEDFVAGYEGAPIWSTALMDIWWSLGKSIADTLVLETHSRWGNLQTFTSAALALISAESDLYGGKYRADIMRAMNERAVIKYIDQLPYEDESLTTRRSREWQIAGSTGGDAEYLLHLPQTATLNISLCSDVTDFDTVLEVFNFDGTSTGLVNDDDRGCASGSRKSSLKGVTLAAGDYYVAVGGWNGAEGNYALEINYVDELAVYVLDEGLREGNVVKPRFYIENNGLSTVSNFTMEYYFFVAEGKTPVLEDWWTPDCTQYLESMGGGLYRIVFDFTGITLGPGGRTPADSGMIVGLHFSDWGTWGKTDDFSNPGVSSYALNEKVAVFNSDDELIYGNMPPDVPAPEPTPMPTALEVYSKDEALLGAQRTQPRIYLVNNDTTSLSNFKIRYFLTKDGTNTPVYQGYWTPGCSGSMENRGGQYAVLLECQGTTLEAGGRQPASDGFVFNIRNQSWTGWNKWNDFSQPGSSSYALTDKIAVYDSEDHLVYGTEP